MRSEHVTQSNGGVVQKSSIRKLPIVDRELWLAILTMLSSLLCPETDRNIRIGKQGYVFYFTDFKK